MKTIFDCETELGTCEVDLKAVEVSDNGASSGEWTACVHTKAALTRAKGMLRIEQRCFLRSGDDLSDHPDVKPEMILEPALGTEEESLVMVKGIHQQFTEKVRQQLGNGCAA